MSSETISTANQRLLSELLPALLGQGSFSPGNSDAQRAIAVLGGRLCRSLEQSHQIVLLGGNPVDPLPCSVIGLTVDPIDPTLILEGEARQKCQLHLAGFWRDRRLAVIFLREGLTSAEFTTFHQLLSHHAGKSRELRNRLFEEQTRGHLPHVSLIFLDDLTAPDTSLPWPAWASLAMLHRDLNQLSRVHGLPSRNQLDWRKQLLITALALPHQSGKLADFFANIDLIAEDIDSYDKDELVLALLEHLDDALPGELCLQLCTQLGPLQPKNKEEEAPLNKKRRVALQWITRRLAERMMEQGHADPEHFHALVLNKVLLYEEIPQQMRPRVASLQVLTSFLSDPQKYFTEVENSHSAEVLETRLWRILEMLPKLFQVLRFDVARQVLDFSQRFGPTFELQNKPELLTQLMDAAAGVLTETSREQQAVLMQALPRMGKTGVCLLIDLADHHNRSIRRAAIDTLVKIGQPIVPVLFETLATKQGWHYLRNMLLLLTQLNAGGPKVEKLFRKCLSHSEANIRKEALPGIAKLLREAVAEPVAAALEDGDLEVKKCAAACLGLTGVTDPEVYKRLAAILSGKTCTEELAVQIVASINRLKPQPLETPDLETALLGLLGIGGFLGIGGRKASSSQTLRVSAVQALGFVGTGRSRKALVKMSTDQSVAMSGAMSGAVAETLRRLAARSV